MHSFIEEQSKLLKNQNSSICNLHIYQIIIFLIFNNIFFNYKASKIKREQQKSVELIKKFHDLKDRINKINELITKQSFKSSFNESIFK
jgi:hypothetical protein